MLILYPKSKHDVHFNMNVNSIPQGDEIFQMFGGGNMKMHFSVILPDIAAMARR